MASGIMGFKLAFELSPIILTNGIAGNIPYNMLPIMALTEAANLPLGVLGGLGNMSLDNFFAHYIPLPGATMIDQDVAMYPFANQTVAANAVVTKPLAMAFHMIVPARGQLSYFAKLPIMMMLQRALEYHNSHGGTYTLLTPSFIYTNCLMQSMHDVSPQSTHQVQNTWQLNFIKPLITVEDALSAQGSLNNLMQKMSSGSPIAGGPQTSGIGLGTGTPVTAGGTVPAISGSPPLSVPGVGSPFGEAPVYTQGSGPPLSVPGTGAPF